MEYSICRLRFLVAIRYRSFIHRCRPTIDRKASSIDHQLWNVSSLESRERKERDILYTRPRGVLLLARALPLSGIFFFFCFFLFPEIPRQISRYLVTVRQVDLRFRANSIACTCACIYHRVHAYGGANFRSAVSCGKYVIVSIDLQIQQHRRDTAANVRFQQIAPAESWRHILTSKHAFPLSVECRMSSSIRDLWHSRSLLISHGVSLMIRTC